MDVVTEAGVDGVLARQKDISEILRSIAVSVNLNHSTYLFVVGHHDCRGNPADQATHHAEIRKAVQRLKTHWPKQEVSGCGSTAPGTWNWSRSSRVAAGC